MLKISCNTHVKSSINEPPHDKTNEMTCAHCEDLDQPGGRRRRSEAECVECSKGLHIRCRRQHNMPGRIKRKYFVVAPAK